MRSARLVITLFALSLLAVLSIMLAGRFTSAAAPDAGSPWTRYQLSGGSITDIDAVSASDAWVSGGDGIVGHWDGGSWEAVDISKVIGASAVNTLDMLAGNNVWAYASGTFIRYDGTMWTSVPDSVSATMYSISMLSSTDGWTSGANARFGHWDGTTWTEVVASPSVTETMFDLEMFSANDGWAAGGVTIPQVGQQGKIARWNGTSWDAVPSPVNNRIFYGIDFSSANEGWVVGSGGTTLRWNGTSWTLVPPPAVCQLSCGAVTLNEVHSIGPNDAWAVGSTNGWTSNSWHWDGTVWTEINAPTGSPLNSVFMLASNDGWSVATRGTIYRWNGVAWTVATTQWLTNGLYGLDFVAPNDGWAVGVLNQTTPPAWGLQHWDGSTWTEFQPPAFGPGPMKDVDMLASNQAWAVGSQAAFYWNGSTWTQQSSPGNFMDAVSMVSPTDGWAVGSGGDIVHFDGTSWTNYTSPTTTNLWSIDMVDANEGWAGGTLGLMLHYQNGTWTQVAPNPGTTTIEAIQMLNANEGWAVGYGGQILHYTGGTWAPVSSPVAVNLLGIHMLNTNEGWAVGVSPTGGTSAIIHYQGGTWTQVNSPTRNNLRDVFVFPDGKGWAVGESPGVKLYLGDVFGGGTPTPTSTAAPPSNTPTAGATNTVALSTPTRTPAPPSLTPTLPSSTPTATATPIPTCGLVWRPISSPNPGSDSNNLRSVSALSSNDVWAVGYYNDAQGSNQTLTIHWNGSAWSTIPSPNVGTGHNYLYSVSALSPTDVWAVGANDGASGVQTLTMRWDGSAWNVVPSPNPVSGNNGLMGVDAVSAGDVWAVGYTHDGSEFATLTMHWNGSAWSTISSPNPGSRDYYLNGVSALSANDVWAVGTSSDGTDQTLTMHWDGSAWSVVPSPNPGGTDSQHFSSVSAISSNDVWAVGVDGGGTLTMHWDGSAWSVVPSPSSGGSYLFSVSAISSNDVWAVGKGTTSTENPLIIHWNGSAWNLVPSPHMELVVDSFSGVSAMSATDVWAVGSYHDASAHTLTQRYNDPCVTPTPSLTATTVPSTSTSTATTQAIGTQTVTSTATATACALQFTDVPEGHTFYAFIRCLACRGIINGYPCGGDGEPCNSNNDPYFRPGNLITRGQLTKIVAISAGYNDPVSGQTFEDVLPGTAFYTYTEQLAADSVMGGYPCGQVDAEPCVPPDNRPYFRPGANATRGQTAKIILNASGLSDPPPDTYTFADVEVGSTFHVYIENLLSFRPGMLSGYLCGGPGEPCDDQDRPYFRPNNPLTRGQSTKMVANMFYPGCEAVIR